MGKTNQSEIREPFLYRHRRVFLLIGAFVIPVVIYLAVMMSLGFYPWGEKTTLFMDLKDQYTEFLASLKYITEPDSSLMFSWSRSMGGNALGLYAYYGGGLLPFLVWLVPVSEIYLAVFLIQVFGVGLCGLSFALYLEFGIAEKRTRLSILVFSSCYALMSYFIVYSGCYMWIAGGIFLPLVLLGIEKILAGKKGLLLYLFLTLSMISNYYTAYMICLFSVLYFFLRVITIHSWAKEERSVSLKKSGKAFLKYAGAGVLSAMSAMPVLLPMYMDLTSGKLAASGSEVSGTSFPFMDVFHKLLPFQYDSITNENAYPSIYAGTIAVVLAVWFFIQKKRSLKEKIGAGVILAILFASFYFKKLDCIWHGFQMPNWFPYRYAFVFGFFLLFMAFRAYEKGVPEKPVLRVAIPFSLLVICSVELFFNARVITSGLGDQFGYMDRSVYQDFYEQTEPLVQKVKDTDSGWYRMDKDYEFSKNDAMLLGYRGMTHYSSTYNAAVNTLTPRLGIAQTWFWNSGYGATPLLDSLFGVKYRMAVKAMPGLYKPMDVSGGVTLYENPLALSPGFAAEAGVMNSPMPEGDVFSNQNTVLSGITGQESSCLSLMEYAREDLPGETKLRVTAVDENPMYLYIEPDHFSWGDICVNDQIVSNYFSSETTCAVYLGTFRAGEELVISVRCADAAVVNAWIASFDTSRYEKTMRLLGDQSLVLDRFGTGDLEGRITMKEGQVVVTSIPYDDGYEITVDGESVNAGKWLDTFICFPADAGEHRIEIVFYPKGWKMGCLLMILSVVTVLLIGVVPLIKKRRRNKSSKGHILKRGEKQ